MDHQLLTFVTVAEKKNFTRAAQELHVTQSAVTLAIKTLEKNYKTKLLDRTNKYVRLTKAGEILYHHAKEILSHYEKVQRLIDDLIHSASGPLSIGSSYTFGEYLLPGIIAKFKQLYPLIIPSVSIRNSKRIISQLLRHELDLGIIEGDLQHPELLIQPFAQDEMVVIVSASHRLAGVMEVEVEELLDETWIFREEGSGTRQATDRFFEKIGTFPASTMSFGSSQIIKGSVEAGLGISILSEYAVRRELDLGTIHTVRIKNQPITRNYSYAIHKSDFRAKAIDLFLDFLRTYSALDFFSQPTETWNNR
ncbi:LysR family transcriptional regulator [Brevibacillus marinus]|uniref:LysR family transcriptional regulator n=1 Tax=Brevibacillus marinus TaxID=2496837 RepID=UPI000F81D79A|nr:LysR family transcriptional regulator [Brevibacillus marinus]